MMHALEGIEAEVGRLLLRAFHFPCDRELCGCAGMFRVVGSAPELGLDRWALMADLSELPSTEALAERWTHEPEQQEHGVRFIAAFGLPWAALTPTILWGHARAWATLEIREWMIDPDCSVEQLLALRRFTGDKPSQAGAALLTMHDYRAATQ